MNKIPILYSFPRPDNLKGVAIFCKYCRSFHYHGEGDGHRGAHCSSSSPYRKTGYIIKRMKQPIPKEIIDVLWEIQETLLEMRCDLYD